MVRLDGGEFLMGTEDPIGFPADGEGTVRAVTLRPFWIATVAVSNAWFAAFVEATSYITDAEFFLPLFTRVRGIGILRTSHSGHSAKFV
jgi:formylglycine-generating enzyme